MACVFSPGTTLDNLLDMRIERSVYHTRLLEKA